VLLSYYAGLKPLADLTGAWRQHGDVALPAALLAAYAIADHDRMGKLEDETEVGFETDLAVRAARYWKRNPLGVMLAIADLLAEGGRLCWQVFHPHDACRRPTDGECLNLLSCFLPIHSVRVHQPKHPAVHDCVVEYNCPWPQYGVQSLKPCGKPWEACQAVHEEPARPADDWDARRKANAPKTKERRVQALWSTLSPDPIWVEST
jgi:hypothetical protein